MITGTRRRPQQYLFIAMWGSYLPQVKVMTPFIDSQRRTESSVRDTTKTSWRFVSGRANIKRTRRLFNDQRIRSICICVVRRVYQPV